MFTWWGAQVFRLRAWVLAGAAAFLVLAAVWGTGVFGALGDTGFEDPASEASQATTAAEAILGGGHDLLVLVRSDDLTVDDPAFASGVEQAVAALPADLVDDTVGYAETGSAAFVSEDRHATYVAVQVPPGTGDADYWGLVEGYDAPEGFDVGFGGNLAMNSDINAQVSEDIAQAEMISFPVLLVLLLVVFGGLVAAGLPLAVGAVAILGAFTVLRVLTTMTEVSVFAVNIVTMLGLGLAIDYALFILSRFREQLHAGHDVERALVTTMSTAGRTVAVSGLTVALALSSLLLFPQVFFRSMGLGGIAAVVVAMAASLTALPAVLALLGRRVDAGRVPFLNRRPRGRRCRSLGTRRRRCDGASLGLRRHHRARAAGARLSVPARRVRGHRPPGAPRGNSEPRGRGVSAAGLPPCRRADPGGRARRLARRHGGVRRATAGPRRGGDRDGGR